MLDLSSRLFFPIFNRFIQFYFYLNKIKEEKVVMMLWGRQLKGRDIRLLMRPWKFLLLQPLRKLHLRKKYYKFKVCQTESMHAFILTYDICYLFYCKTPEVTSHVFLSTSIRPVGPAYHNISQQLTMYHTAILYGH